MAVVALRSISSMLLGDRLSAPLAGLSFCALGLLIGSGVGCWHGCDALRRRLACAFDAQFLEDNRVGELRLETMSGTGFLLTPCFPGGAVRIKERSPKPSMAMTSSACSHLAWYNLQPHASASAVLTR
ncbi:hypothetical protein HBI56_110540 [Parastagonospora nodorum]|nr:hypothetical protein HBH46_129580 [Parastagonospora nodorum]KAH4207499.1 hypothetical protein HBI95_104890 [Parastagonospora nodorum]KAH4230628.1 hypothetical protein HBI06_085250 [Parastagonospora nodorum]KAH4245443.1 hypothetical protein HBI05_068390 [Parastagonospora nodorum]KAH4302946.1 hypothetical protein HBI01_090420 [Parastagonospora nodorum]